MNRARNMTRVALPAHKVGPVTAGGYQYFHVPGDYYPDGEARDFALPSPALAIMAESKVMTYGHAVYCDAATAIECGVMGIELPRRQSLWNQKKPLRLRR